MAFGPFAQACAIARGMAMASTRGSEVQPTQAARLKICASSEMPNFGRPYRARVGQ